MSLAIPQYALQLLQELVDTNSGTVNAEGCETVRQRLVPALEDAGLRVAMHDVGGGRRILSAEAPDARPTVAFVGHLDTVFNNPRIPFGFKVDCDKLRGPGVIDMKGGIVAMIDVMKRLRGSDAFKAVRILLNDDEEIGSPHSKEILKQLARGLKTGLVFEPGLPDGAVVTAHSGVRWLEMTVHGRAAHAGLEPEKGLNAAVELSHKIVKLAELSNYDKNLSVNPGVISGGSAANVVCETATVKIDVRFVEPKDLDETMRKVDEIKNTAHVCSRHDGLKPRTEIRELSDLPPMPFASTSRVFEMAKTVAHSLGQTLPGQAVGYASDGNHLATIGMELLVGVGPYGGGMHSTGEFMLVSSFAERVALCTELVRRLVS